MERPYVILGNGAAAVAAIKAIRRHDRLTPVTVVTAGPVAAFSPALLPYVISGRARERLPLTDETFYAAHGVSVLAERPAVSVLAEDHEVVLDDDTRLSYGALLVATGASAKGSMVPGADEGEPLTLRSLGDARRIVAGAAGHDSACVLGAGLAGLEMAMALRELGKQVTVVAGSGQILSQDAGSGEAGVVQLLLERAGIRVLLRRTVEGLERRDGRRWLLTAEGDRVPAGVLVAAKGAAPNADLLGMDDPGLLRAVDRHMRTCLPDVYAAGDVALSRDALSGEQRAFSTWPSACREGAVAGTVMAGGEDAVEAEIAFNVLPVFGVPATFIGATAGSTPGGAEVVAWGGNDAARGVYRRLVVRDGKLTAAAMVGPWRDAGLLRHVIETGMEVDRELTAALVAGSGWGKVKGHLLPRLRPRR